MRNEEIQSLSGVDEFGEFYRRLKQLKDYHRKFADDVRYDINIEMYIFLMFYCKCSWKNPCPWNSARWMKPEIIPVKKPRVSYARNMYGHDRFDVFLHKSLG